MLGCRLRSPVMHLCHSGCWHKLRALGSVKVDKAKLEELEAVLLARFGDCRCIGRSRRQGTCMEERGRGAAQQGAREHRETRRGGQARSALSSAIFRGFFYVSQKSHTHSKCFLNILLRRTLLPYCHTTADYEPRLAETRRIAGKVEPSDHALTMAL